MVNKLFLAFLIGISASLFFDSAFSQEEVAGRAKVISGDTLSIKNIEDGKQFTFRLWGIDAPELDQPCEKKNGQSVDCGVLARNAVRAIIKRSELVCVDFEKDSAITFTIVGDDEADIKSGLISINSPIARALIGKEKGDIVSAETPSGQKEFEILKILYE